MVEFLRLVVSALQKEEAQGIARALESERLAAACIVTHGLSDVWWRAEIEGKGYYTLTGFTKESNRERIESVVEVLQMTQDIQISFYVVEKADMKFFEWLKAKLG